MESTMVSDRKRYISWFGRVAGPLLAMGIWFGLDPESLSLSPEAQATAGVAVLMALWWMTEALPLAATALLPLVLFPLAGVMPISEAAPPYANKFIFLFLGGFLIARAVEKWNLHRRIALITVLAAGTRPHRLIGGFMLATGGLSMWISNTASTVLMLPIGMSLVALISRHARQSGDRGEPQRDAFATAMMLGIAYAASIGGLATLVGTPTNLFLAGFVDDLGYTIGFSQWMIFALPFSVLFLIITWLVLTRWVFPVGTNPIRGGREVIRDELKKMGPMSRGERIVLIVFAATACGWLLREPLTQWSWLTDRIPPVARLNDTLIALIGALTLFVIPVDSRRNVFALDWKTAETVPWGVLLLFGGGFCLAEAFSRSGLADWIGSGVSAVAELPWLVVVLVVVAMIIFLTELTSNTPTAATFLPILYGVAKGIGLDPMALLIPATIAASCAFMLPVATPPNAIVFGSGYITMGDMLKAGIWLNMLGIILITLWVALFGHWMHGAAG